MYKARCFLTILFVAGMLAGGVHGGAVESSITVVADGLVDAQDVDGYWPGEPQYTGSIVLGLVCAYEETGKVEYKLAAELGGDFILEDAAGNFYGDEAYALAQLSEISVNPNDNTWRTELSAFYERVTTGEGGTSDYIESFKTSEPSTAVFYVAYHTMAADYVEDADKTLWREALIGYLSEVSDENATYPVLALGVATMALASTGDLDATPVRTVPGGQQFWTGKTLADLPDILVNRQVPVGEDYANSFFWKFEDGSCCQDPQGCDDACAGYTEDAIFATLGLVAASNFTSEDYCSEISAIREILPFGVYSGGVVYEHIWLGGLSYYAFAGEMLQALCALSPVGDLDGDGYIDVIDLSIFAANWLEPICIYPNWCDGADIDHSSTVNLVDFALLANNWLECTGGY